MRIVIEPWLTCVIVRSAVGDDDDNALARESGEHVISQLANRYSKTIVLHIGQPEGGQIGEKHLIREKPDRNAEKADTNDLTYNHPSQDLFSDPRIAYQYVTLCHTGTGKIRHVAWPSESLITAEDVIVTETP